MVTIYMDVVKKGGETAEQIIKDIKKIQNYRGVSGSISFMENGDANTDLIKAYYSKGKINIIDE